MKKSGRHGVFVGLATVDLVLRVGRHPRPNEKTVASERRLCAGGPAANAAIAFARLGGRATLFTALGQSPLAAVVRADLALHGVEVVDHACGPDAEVPLAVVLSDASDGSRAVVLDRGCAANGECVEIDESLLDGAEVVVCDGHHHNLALPLLEKARARDLPTVLDAGSWKSVMTMMLPFIDYAIASADFAPAGGAIPRLQELGARHAAVSAGGGPICWRDATGAGGEIAVPQVEVVDTLGAGDVLHGAFAWFLAEGLGFAASLHEAARVASASCAVIGRLP